MAPLSASVLKDAMASIAKHQLHRRADNNIVHGQGASPPRSFNNQGFFALFALLGGSMVLAALWFFFWAKNGGFKWRQGDWDDYKSTVLRRKGPDGRTLSNATKSTKLGGGSVVHGGSYGQTEYTESSGYTEQSEMTETKGDHGMRGGGGLTGHHSQRYGNRRERKRDPELAQYRHEKVARVGGINRQNDGMHFDHSTTVPSEVQSDLSQQPLVKEKKVSKKEKLEQEKARKQRQKAAQKHLKESQKEAAANEKKAKLEAKAAEKQRAEAEKAAAKAKKSKSSRPTSSGHRGERSLTQNRAPPTEYTAPMTEYTNDDTATVYTSPYTDYAPIAQPSPPPRTAQSGHRSTSSQHSSYYDAYRPNHQSRSSNTPPRNHSQSPRKPRRVTSEHDWATAPQPNSDTGTKTYQHYIPGLSSAGSVAVSDSVSQAGRRNERRTGNGYRRGGARRDSLSDSEM